MQFIDCTAFTQTNCKSVIIIILHSHPSKSVH